MLKGKKKSKYGHYISYFESMINFLGVLMVLWLFMRTSLRRRYCNLLSNDLGRENVRVCFIFLCVCVGR